MLVGATFPAKKGQVCFGRFYLGKRRVPAVPCSHLSHEDRRRFRKYAANFELAEHTGVFDHKPAGRALGHMRCGRTIGILPHTSGIETLPMPPSFQKCGEKSETFDHAVIFDNKTAGKQGVIISVWSEVPSFSPHFRFWVV